MSKKVQIFRFGVQGGLGDVIFQSFPCYEYLRKTDDPCVIHIGCRITNTEDLFRFNKKNIRVVPNTTRFGSVELKSQQPIGAEKAAVKELGGAGYYIPRLQPRCWTAPPRYPIPLVTMEASKYLIIPKSSGEDRRIPTDIVNTYPTNKYKVLGSLDFPSFASYQLSLLEYIALVRAANHLVTCDTSALAIGMLFGKATTVYIDTKGDGPYGCNGKPLNHMSRMMWASPNVNVRDYEGSVLKPEGAMYSNEQWS
jgi:hypothetical protein